MRRLAGIYLNKWKTKADRHPLLVRGARQVGKTWLVRDHSQSYSNLVEINFESDFEYHSLFRDLFGKPQELLKAISLLSGKKIEIGKTLLFLDEIQSCKEALLSLRYFKEELPAQHVIAAGSLIEFALKDLSFPVGRIEFFYLFPMNFEEYLGAIGRDDLLQAILNSSVQAPLSEAIHQKLLEEVSIYGLLGGLPEVLAAYREGGDLQRCQEIQQILVASFREDFHKYASKANIAYLQIVFQAIPRLLGRQLKFSHIDPGVKSRELSNALGFLEQAGLAYRVPHSSGNGLPLGAQINLKKFKVFFLDVGLSQRILGLNLSQLYLERKEMLAHRGAIAEQWVAQELISLTPPNQSPQLYYWHREEKSSNAEIDFLMEHQGEGLPIEVKSDRGGRLKSLHIFLKEKHSFVSQALKVSMQNFSREGKVLTLPFYALMKLREGGGAGTSGEVADGRDSWGLFQRTTWKNGG